MPDLVHDLRRRIAAAGDPERAPQMQAYMKSALPYRGVMSVPLRAIIGEVVPAHPLPDRAAWRAAVLELWDEAAYREERYAALAVAGHRLYRPYRDPAALDLYRHLVVTGAWWDVVDTIATHHVGEILERYPAEVTPVLARWAVDDDLWLRRTAVLSQLRRKAGTDVDLLRLALEQNLEGSRTAGSSSSARRSAGRCGSTRGPTPTGCGPSWPSTRTGSPASAVARPSSTSALRRRGRRRPRGR